MNTGGRPPSELEERKLVAVELTIELGEFQPIAPPGECRETARLARLPPAEPPPGIARPRAVIDRPRCRLAEFAVIDDIDADFGLLAADFLDRRGQRCRVGTQIIGLAGKLGAVEFDQYVGARQAADMRGEYPSIAAFHGGPNLQLTGRERRA